MPRDILAEIGAAPEPRDILAEIGAAPKQSTPAPPPTLEQRGQDVFGFDPDIQRGTILPFGRKNGKTELATPQVIVDIAKSTLLPGHVAQGGSYTPTDVTRMALDINPMGRTPGSRVPPTRQQFIDTAPTKEALKSRSGVLYDLADQKGLQIAGNEMDNFVSGLRKQVVQEGADRLLHPKVVRVLGIMDEGAGRNKSLRDLETLRRQIGTVMKSTEPDERRIGSIMMERLDDFVSGMSAKQTVGGDKSTADILGQARDLWQRYSKVKLLEKARENATIAASGFENGLRTEFRKLLKNDRAMRGFTDAEKKAMKNVVNGGPLRQALRLFGHLGPPTHGANRFLGQTMGVGTGAYVGGAVGGPAGAAIGAIGVPAVGYGSGRAALAETKAAANYARALAARGGTPYTTLGPAQRAAQRSAGPIVGGLLGRPDTPVGPNGGLLINGVEVF